jgi:hypothetical protein
MINLLVNVGAGGTVRSVTVSPTGLCIDMKTAGMRELIQSVFPGRKAA